MARKLIRYISFFLGTVAILFVLVTLILPSKGRVAKEVFIAADRKVVLGQLTNLGNYGAWYPWIQMDTSAKIQVKNGREIAWRGNTRESTGVYTLGIGEGDSSLPFTLQYGAIPAITGAYLLKASPENKGTTVVWYMNMKAGWTPWWRFYAAMLNKLAGPVMEAGLTNLKLQSQQADRYSNIVIHDTVLPKTHLAKITDTVHTRDEFQTLSNLFSRLFQFISQNKLSQTGNPEAQIQVLNDSDLRISAYVPIDKPFVSREGLFSVSRSAQKAISAAFQGKYTDIPAVYKALSQATLRYSSAPLSLSWESYEDGVIPDSDSADCHITVYYLVGKRH